MPDRRRFHHRSLLLAVLLAAGLASGCTYIRRWLVPPQTRANSSAAGYGQARDRTDAELILVVASLADHSTQETAIAVRDGQVMALGALEDLEPMRGDTTRTIQLPGGVGMAGRIAPQARLDLAAMAMDAVDLGECKTVADVIRTLQIAKPMVMTEGGWIWADGIQPALLDKLQMTDLNGALGRVSVLVTPATRMGGLANGAMLARLGDLGTAIGDKAGRLNGRQVLAAWRQLPMPRVERLKPLLAGVLADQLKRGVTEIRAVAASQTLVDALRLLDRDSRLTIRTQVYLDAERPEGRALLHPPPKPTEPRPAPQLAEAPPHPSTKRGSLVQVAGVSLDLDTALPVAPHGKIALPADVTLTYDDDTLRDRLQHAQDAQVPVLLLAGSDLALAQLQRVMPDLTAQSQAPQMSVNLPAGVSAATLETLGIPYVAVTQPVVRGPREFVTAFGQTPQVGQTVQVGAHADLVVWSRDPRTPGKQPPKLMASMVGGVVTVLVGRDVNE